MSCDNKRVIVSTALTGVLGRTSVVTSDSPLVTQKTSVGNVDTYHLTYVPYIALVISSFSHGLSVLKKGATITTLNLSWVFNKAVVEQRIESSLFSTITPAVNGGTSYSLAVTDLSIGDDATLSLIADDIAGDSKAEKTKTLSVLFGNSVWIGLIDGINASTSSSAIIGLLDTLTESVKRSHETTYEVVIPEGEVDSITKKLVYIAPTSLGIPTFKFQQNFSTGGVIALKVFNIENSEGFEEEYTVYVSAYGLLEGQILIIN